jgi:CRP-like cAMP-binding protein
MKPVMKQSAFLTQLPIETLNKFDLFAEVVELRRSEKCIGAGASLECIYFPLTCVYSLELVMPDGISSHLTLLGREDAIGAENWVDTSLPVVARVILSGYAIALRMEIFTAELTRCPELRRTVDLQGRRLAGRLSVTSGCNLRHLLIRRLARWLVNLNEVSRATVFELTHEEIASLLGVRREAITEALARLSHSGVISTTRGRVQIRDIELLSNFACECVQSPPAESRVIRHECRLRRVVNG